MKNLLFAALLSVGVVLAGCAPKAEAPVSTPDTGKVSSDLKGAADDMKGAAGDMKGAAMDLMSKVDFSSPEKIKETVIPAVKDMLAKNPKLAGLNLDVMLNDKVLAVKGDVKNNDQKRAIDETVNPLMAQMKAAGLNFLNSAVVKG